MLRESVHTGRLTAIPNTRCVVRERNPKFGRHIAWHALDGSAKDRTFLDNCMHGLLDLLRSEPLGLAITGGLVTEADFASAMLHLRNGNLNGCLNSARQVQTGQAAHRIGLLVYCDTNSPAAMAARGRLKHAAWGINLSGVLSLVYSQANKLAIWHEALHLLGAQDHYDLTGFAWNL